MRIRKQYPYALVVADPPWQHLDQLPGVKRSAGAHYRTMSVDEIEAFHLPPIARDAALLLWRVASMQDEALSVALSWGFRVKSEIVWAKVSDHSPVLGSEDAGGASIETLRLRIGMGRYVRNCHETCLIATRGKAASLVLRHDVPSVFFAPRGRHSEKPDRFYQIAEQLFPGPRIEMFARRRREGWDQVGDELDAASAAPWQAPTST